MSNVTFLCDSCGEEFRVHFTNKELEVQWCPFCGESLSTSESFVQEDDEEDEFIIDEDEGDEWDH